MAVDVAIHAQELTKNYNGTLALDNLNLQVEAGQVYGFLGPNGSGKSTAIRILLDLIRASSGSVTVLGLNPRSDAVALHRRVGYLPGDFVVDGRQSSLELLTYLANLRGGATSATMRSLAERLDLDVHRPIKSLSRGNRQKVGLIQAVMHEPELLILDEPTSGLDPFLQHEFAAMMREVAKDGRTAFVSSHVMGEVQQIADTVAIIRAGSVVAVEQVEELRKRSMHNVTIEFATAVDAREFVPLANVHDVEVTQTRLTCRLDGQADALIKAAARHTVLSLVVEEPDLEELFFKYYDRTRESTNAD